MSIAIVSVVYNRTDSLARQLRSLERAVYPEPVTLVISIDKSRTTAVEDFANSYTWPHGEKRVITHDHNLGTRRHMLSLGALFSDFNALIVLEDDITVAPAFYLFAKACVAAYGDDPLVAGISLYSFPINYETRLPFTPVHSSADVYLMQCAQSWGEVWTRNQWAGFRKWYDAQQGNFLPDYRVPHELFTWPESSWLRFHTRYCIERQLFFVYPYVSLSTNNQDSGVNARDSTTLYQAVMSQGRTADFRLPQTADIAIRYDAFFEPLFLADSLGVDPHDLTVDLYAQKTTHRRYLLTLKALPYAVNASFALREKPMEMNVINHNDGADIFCYDTTRKATPPTPVDNALRYQYFYGEAFYKQRTMIGWKGCLRLWIQLIKNKLSK